MVNAPTVVTDSKPAEKQPAESQDNGTTPVTTTTTTTNENSSKAEPTQEKQVVAAPAPPVNVWQVRKSASKQNGTHDASENKDAAAGNNNTLPASGIIMPTDFYQIRLLHPWRPLHGLRPTRPLKRRTKSLKRNL